MISDLGKSISSGYLLFFLNNVVALFLTPYMLKFISKEEYALYVLCVDFLAWFSFLEFGISKVAESRTGHLVSKSDKLGINKMFSTSLIFQIFIAIIIVPIFYFAMKFGMQLNNIPNLNIIILLFSFSAGLSVIRNLFSSLIIASGKIYLDNSIQFFINILNYILVLTLAPILGGLGLALISLFILILMLIRSQSRLKFLYPYLNLSSKMFDKKELRYILSNGLYFSIGSIATVLVSKIDSFVIGKYMELELVTSYFITIKLFFLVQKFIQILYSNYRPYISQFYGNANFEAIKIFYNTSSWFLYGLSTFLIGIAIFVNASFINFWVGKEYYFGEKFSILFGCYILFDLYTLPSRNILISSLFKIRSHSLARVLEGLFRLLFISLCIVDFQENLLPLSSLISGFLFGNYFFYVQVNKYFNQNGNIYPDKFIYFVVFNFISILFFLNFDLDFCIPYLFIIQSFFILVYTFKFQLPNLLILKELVNNYKNV